MQVGQITGFADRRESIGDARAALKNIASSLFQASGAELSEFVGDLDDLMRPLVSLRRRRLRGGVRSSHRPHRGRRRGCGSTHRPLPRVVRRTWRRVPWPRTPEVIGSASVQR